MAPDDRSPQRPDTDVLVDKGSLTNRKEFLIDVEVDNDVDLPGMFTVDIASTDADRGISGLIDDKILALGSPVEIKMGYAENLKTVIIGEVTGLEPSFTFDHLPKLTVRGYDRRHRLHRGRRTRTFIDQTDSAIATRVAEEAQLKVRVEKTEVEHEYVLQANQTDMEFLQERARRINFEVFVDDRTLVFRQVQNTRGEGLTLTLGDELLEFHPRLSSLRQLREVKARGWDPKEKEEIVGEATRVAPMGGQKSGPQVADALSIANIGDRPVRSQEEADRLAEARLEHVALRLVTGEGVCRGNPDVQPGGVIKMDGVGGRFGGPYYVTSARHRYTSRDDYYTYFSIRRNAW